MKRIPSATLLMLAVLLGACDAAEHHGDDFERALQALEKGDYAEAYCLWRPHAERGSAEAQYHVGWLYANGNGLAVDVAEAMVWWKRAAEQGHADAQFAVGLAYTTGEGIGTDLEAAVGWYLDAAQQGHQDARDILTRLNGDPSLDLLKLHPEIAKASWFGWDAEVRRDGINVRSKPSTDSRVKVQLGKGARVRVIGQRGDWYWVVLPRSGDKAWIYRNLLRKAQG